MSCARCGADVVVATAFCAGCGATGQSIKPAVTSTRPWILAMIAVLDFVAAAICLPAGVFMFVNAGASDPAGQGIALFLGIAAVALGALGLVSGLAVWTLRPHGRTLQIVLAVIGLLAIPVGTVVSALILAYMLTPGPRALFAGASASVSARMTAEPGSAGGVRRI